MPRPNIPLRGGPHSPQPSGSGNGCSKCRELAAELEKVKQGAAKANSPGFIGKLPIRGNSSLLVWAALGACGVALLFALLAMIKHA